MEERTITLTIKVSEQELTELFEIEPDALFLMATSDKSGDFSLATVEHISLNRPDGE